MLVALAVSGCSHLADRDLEKACSSHSAEVPEGLVTAGTAAPNIFADLSSRWGGVRWPKLPADGSLLPGRYSSESPSLAKRIGGGFLSGGSLYLLHDGRYVYTEWADVEPETIYQAGAWRFLDGLVVLLPAGEAAGALTDRSFLPFCLQVDGKAELRLAGTPEALSKLVRAPVSEGNLPLLLHSRAQLRFEQQSKVAPTYESVTAGLRRRVIP